MLHMVFTGGSAVPQHVEQTDSVERYAIERTAALLRHMAPVYYRAELWDDRGNELATPYRHVASFTAEITVTTKLEGE